MVRLPVVLAVPALTVAALLAVPDSAVPDSAVQAASPAVHATAVGDYGALTNTSRVLTALKAAEPEAHFALGDLSYGKTGAERAWCDFVTARVGVDFPFELVAGNHESNGINGNIGDFAACLPNRLPGLVGTYAKQFYVDYPQGDPTVRFVMISPGITFPEGLWDYAVGSARYQWTASVIDGARAAGIPWVVVGLHMPCLTVGNHTCESGVPVNDLLLQKKVDLVLAGHEHSYQRTKQLALRNGCTSLATETYDADCVVDSDNQVTQGVGTVYATVGTGGVSLGAVNLDDPEAPYFAKLMGSNSSDPSFGYFDLVADAYTLTGRFVPVTGSYRDAFTITRGTPVTGTTTTSTTSTSAAAPPQWAADSFSRTVSSGWGTAEAGGAWTVAPVAMGSTVSVDKSATGSGTYVWLRGRRVPGAGDYRAKLWWQTGGRLRLSLSRGAADNAETAVGASALLSGGVTAGEQLRVRMQVTGSSPTTLRAKVWRVGQGEPSAWTVTATDSTAGLQTAGHVGVTTYLSGSATNAPVVVSIDDWRAAAP